MPDKPRIVRDWDSMPPEVYADGEVFSTRVLAMKYKKMEDALQEIIKHNVESHEDAFEMKDIAIEALGN